MRISNIISNKIQSILGNTFAIFPISYFNKNYTESKLVNDGFGGCDWVRVNKSEYGEFRKNKIVGVISLTNAERSNVNYFYMSANYTIQFSVPRNVEKRNNEGLLLENPPFNFDADIENLADQLINQDVDFAVSVAIMPIANYDNFGLIYKYTGETTATFTQNHYYICKIVNNYYSWVETNKVNGRITISEPSYVTSENDGEYIYDIMQINGVLVMSDSANFGGDYKVAIKIDNAYVEVDDIVQFNENYDINSNAIQKQGKVKTEQHPSTSGWVATFSFDDTQTSNLARQLLMSILHDNIEVIYPTELTESAKRKLKAKITRPNGTSREFLAIPSVALVTQRNSIGTVTVTLTDDGGSNG